MFKKDQPLTKIKKKSQHKFHFVGREGLAETWCLRCLPQRFACIC